MADLLDMIREVIALPLWDQLLAVGFLLGTPLVIVRWRGNTGWHKSG